MTRPRRASVGAVLAALAAAVTLPATANAAPPAATGLGVVSESSYGREADGQVERRSAPPRGPETLPQPAKVSARAAAAMDIPTGEEFCVWVDGSVGGSVPATLGLTLGAPAAFDAFLPGVEQAYRASVLANVISTAGEATMSVADPSATAPGRLVNGAFSLPTALQAKAYSVAVAGGAFADVGSAATPTSLLQWVAPVSNDAVTVEFAQRIGARDPLRTGTYSKTLTFTLSTSNP